MARSPKVMKKTTANPKAIQIMRKATPKAMKAMQKTAKAMSPNAMKARKKNTTTRNVKRSAFSSVTTVPAKSTSVAKTSTRMARIEHQGYGGDLIDDDKKRKCSKRKLTQESKNCEIPVCSGPRRKGSRWCGKHTRHSNNYKNGIKSAQGFFSQVISRW